MAGRTNEDLFHNRLRARRSDIVLRVAAGAFLRLHAWPCSSRRRGRFIKERGARNALLKLSPEAKKVGVVAASAGKHAMALASCMRVTHSAQRAACSLVLFWLVSAPAAETGEVQE